MATIRSRKILVEKSTGEVEPFSSEKFARSLEKAGAATITIDKILNHLNLKEYILSKEIHKQAFRALKKWEKPAATRYNLKQSLFELGPSGFPFEILVSKVLNAMGYVTETGQTLRGKCIQHEVDVIGKKGNTVLIVECKFHNSFATKCDVKIPLYIHSRFRDLASSSTGNMEFKAAIFNNTRFSTDAIEYANCAEISLVGWDYPQENNLKSLIEEHGLYPITCLYSLNKKEKHELLEDGLILAKDLLIYQNFLDKFKSNKNKYKSIFNELKALRLVD